MKRIFEHPDIADPREDEIYFLSMLHNKYKAPFGIPFLCKILEINRNTALSQWIRQNVKEKANGQCWMQGELVTQENFFQRLKEHFHLSAFPLEVYLYIAGRGFHEDFKKLVDLTDKKILYGDGQNASPLRENALCAEILKGFKHHIYAHHDNILDMAYLLKDANIKPSDTPDLIQIVVKNAPNAHQMVNDLNFLRKFLSTPLRNRLTLDDLKLLLFKSAIYLPDPDDTFEVAPPKSKVKLDRWLAANGYPEKSQLLMQHRFVKSDFEKALDDISILIDLASDNSRLFFHMLKVQIQKYKFSEFPEEFYPRLIFLCKKFEDTEILRSLPLSPERSSAWMTKDTEGKSDFTTAQGRFFKMCISHDLIDYGMDLLKNMQLSPKDLPFLHDFFVKEMTNYNIYDLYFLKTLMQSPQCHVHYNRENFIMTCRKQDGSSFVRDLKRTTLAWMHENNLKIDIKNERYALLGSKYDAEMMQYAFGQFPMRTGLNHRY